MLFGLQKYYLGSHDSKFRSLIEDTPTLAIDILTKGTARWIIYCAKGGVEDGMALCLFGCRCGASGQCEKGRCRLREAWSVRRLRCLDCGSQGTISWDPANRHVISAAELDLQEKEEARYQVWAKSATFAVLDRDATDEESTAAEQRE